MIQVKGRRPHKGKLESPQCIPPSGHGSTYFNMLLHGTWYNADLSCSCCLSDYERTHYAVFIISGYEACGLSGSGFMIAMICYA